MATVRANPNFDPENAAKTLKKAMKGLGTDERAIIKCLGAHDNAQRREIASQFKTMYGQDLVAELKSEVGGHFEDVLVAMLLPPPYYLVSELHKAMKGAGTDESTLIEILCSRSNREIEEIKDAYNKSHKKPLEEALSSETSGYFKRMLVSVCNAARNEDQQVNLQTACEDAHYLYDAGEGQLGTDECEFNLVLCTRSFRQLREIFRQYQDVAGRGLEDSIKREMSGSLKDGYLAIVRSVTNLPRYYSHRLYHSMKGAGTDDSTLIRIVVLRSEIDMQEIKDSFAKDYGKSLESFIKGDCSGDYKKMLLELVA